MDCEIEMSFVELKPQIVTEIKLKLGTVTVSSICYKYDNHVYDETCVFFTDDTSDVVGTYDDHCKIVQELMK